MPKEQKKYKLGMALSGGGAKGFAHLGVYQALFERGIYPDVIAGTSAGAFASIFVADGREPKDVIKLFKNKAFREFVEFMIPQGGLFKSDGLITFLKKNVKARKFSDLKIPLKVVATDIENGRSRIFDSGDLIPAVVASCSVPIVFKPIKIGDNYYVDGGLFKNFPVGIIRDECEIVMGVNVSPITTLAYKNSFKYVADRIFHYMTTANTVDDRKHCDYLFESSEPLVYSMFDLDHVEEIYQAGYNLATSVMEERKDDLLKDFPQIEHV